MMQSEDMAQSAQEPAHPPSEERDITHGYQIVIAVTPEGYRVSDAEPLAASPMMPKAQSEDASESEDTIPDLTTALRHVMAVVKANPIGDDAQSQFEAGYSA